MRDSQRFVAHYTHHQLAHPADKVDIFHAIELDRRAQLANFTALSSGMTYFIGSDNDH